MFTKNGFSLKRSDYRTIRRLTNYLSILVVVIIIVSVVLISTSPVRAISSEIDNAQIAEPMMIRTVSATIATGNQHSLAIANDGTLWAWGVNRSGQLGDGTTTSRHYPVRIMEDVVSVAAGCFHSLAIKTDGSLWGWGENRLRLFGSSDNPQLEPIKIMEDVVTVSTGEGHILVIKSDRSLWGWGWNHSGQLGIGETSRQHEPVKIMEDMVAIWAGRWNSMALQADGSLWAWGRNNAAQLGDGTRIDRHSPVKILDNVVAVSGSMALRNDGSIWAWGEGYIGGGTTEIPNPGLSSNHLYPARVMEDVIYISAGVGNSTAIRNDRSLWSWGWSNIIGAGYTNSRTFQRTPIKIMDDVVTASSSRGGGDHTLAVKNDGSLWAWGANCSGQIGDGTYPGIWEVRYYPVHVMDNIMLPTWEYVTNCDGDYDLEEASTDEIDNYDAN